jgi:hypothetical protein
MPKAARLLLPLVGLAAGCPNKPEDSAEPWSCTAPVEAWTVGEILDTEGCGILARVPGEETPWGEPFYVLRVEGSHYDMGYQHGRLVGPYLIDLWWTYMESLAEEAGLGSANALDIILGGMLDTVWEDHYGPNTPEIFQEEFEGFAAGMEAAGLEFGEGDEDLIKMPRRIVTLIDLAMSSQLDFENLGGMAEFLQSGFTEALLVYYGEDPEALVIDPELQAIEDALLAQADPAHDHEGPLLNCSYFAAWGEHTDDGGQYMTRNMDFASDTGIASWAGMTVYVPKDGVPYASISWLGASLGVLAGISREGVAVSAVGAESPFERIHTEPALLRAREALETSTDLSMAMPFLTNTVGDGITRAPTIGYNALVSWGDPRHDGAGAEAVILESNGLETGVFHHYHDCAVEPSLVRFDMEGVATVHTPETDPSLVNAEADAKEIDGEGNIRLFEVDNHGQYVQDAHGNYVEVEDGGQPIQTGYPYDCALYRGDEALAYGVRMHQAAANGPMREEPGLMIQSSSWRGRYWPMREMTRAYREGVAWQNEDGVEVVADNGGVEVKVGLDQAEAISREAALGSNVWDVVYDTTDLIIRVSYESGTGETWVRAADQPAYYEIDLGAVFLDD